MVSVGLASKCGLQGNRTIALKVVTLRKKVMTFEAIFMKITYSTTTKLRLLSQFQNVNESLKVFADYPNVGAGSLKRWIQQYLTGGLANLERPVHNRRYPKKLKLRAVRDYRNHRLPTREILLKYDIRGLS